MSSFLAHFKISISNDAMQSSHLIRVHGILGLTLVRAVIPHLPHCSSPYHIYVHPLFWACAVHWSRGETGRC